MLGKILYERHSDQLLYMIIAGRHAPFERIQNASNRLRCTCFARTHLLHDITCNVAEKHVWQEIVVVIDMLIINGPKLGYLLKKFIDACDGSGGNIDHC